MTGFEAVIAQAEKAAQSQPGEDDYIGENGLIYCGKCHTPRQTRQNVFGHKKVVWCLCRCRSQQRDRQAELLAQTQREMRRKRLRDQGIPDQTLRGARFESARDTELIRKCRRWLDHWDDMRELNAGLLLWGDVGVGKSYAAACICNALLDQGESAAMTSFGRILAAGFEERAAFLERVHRYGLLVIDDLGAERDTEFAEETVFSVIDERYRAEKPLIVTTNLSLEQLKSPRGLAQSRVYDRVLEMCTPIFCGGENQRTAASAEKLKAVQAALRPI